MRRLLLAIVVLIALVVAPWQTPGRRWRVLVDLAVAPAPTSLPVPVHGVVPAALADTFGAPRSGGRRHQGIDIFAARGTPVAAPVPGLVLRVGRNRLGGNVVTLLGPGRQVHYFAHLNRFGFFAAGDLVRPGDVLGYVGDTGNAKGTPPHLHYGIYAPPRGALNPYGVLTSRS